MRNIYSTVMCGTMLVLAVAASAQNLKPGVATIVRVQGEARYSLGDGNWHPWWLAKYSARGPSFKRLTTPQWTWCWARRWNCRKPDRGPTGSGRRRMPTYVA